MNPINPNQVANQPINVCPELEEKICVICTDKINSQPESEGMKETALKCNHFFHSACIQQWLRIKHNCPLCRKHIEVYTPEASLVPEMSGRELLDIPDNLPQAPESSLPSLNEVVRRHLRDWLHSEVTIASSLPNLNEAMESVRGLDEVVGIRVLRRF